MFAVVVIFVIVDIAVLLPCFTKGIIRNNMCRGGIQKVEVNCSNKENCSNLINQGILVSNSSLFNCSLTKKETIQCAFCPTKNDPSISSTCLFFLILLLFVAIICFITVILIICFPSGCHWGDTGRRLKEFLSMVFFYPLPISHDRNQNNTVELIDIKFNAWEYAGCDMLWAGIITCLCDKLEERFGQYRSRYFRRIKDYKKNWVKSRVYSGYRRPYTCCFVPYLICVSAVIPLIIPLIGIPIFFIIETYLRNIFLGVIICGTGISVLAFITLVTRLLLFLGKSTKSYIENLQHSMSRPDFKEELGFMHLIKQEVQLLNDLIEFMELFERKTFRIVLLVDDLDRCENKKVLKMLQAISILLSEPSTRFISLIAVDPRVVVKSLELNIDVIKEDCRINGQDYLKKIIHLPLWLPEMDNDNVKQLIESYLSSQNLTDGGQGDDTPGTSAGGRVDDTPGTSAGGRGDDTPGTSAGGRGDDTPGTSAGGRGDDTPGTSAGGRGDDTPGTSAGGRGDDTPGTSAGGRGDDTPGTSAGGRGDDTPGTSAGGRGDDTPGTSAGGRGDDTPGTSAGGRGDDTPGTSAGGRGDDTPGTSAGGRGDDTPGTSAGGRGDDTPGTSAGGRGDDTPGTSAGGRGDDTPGTSAGGRGDDTPGTSAGGRGDDTPGTSAGGRGDDTPGTSAGGRGDDTPGTSAGGRGDDTPGTSAGGRGDDTPGTSAGGRGDDTPGTSAGGRGDDTPGTSADGRGDDTPGTSAGGRGDDTPGTSAGGRGDDTPGTSAGGRGDDTPGTSAGGQGDDTPGTSAGGRGDDTPGTSAGGQGDHGGSGAGDTLNENNSTEAVDALDQALKEMEPFHGFLCHNPRSIKRIYNILNLATRLYVNSDPEKACKQHIQRLVETKQKVF